ncbi:MAG: hypothetical protein Tsb002_32610 [Wenzhouxiangellaceae bacterium]
MQVYRYSWLPALQDADICEDYVHNLRVINKAFESKALSNILLQPTGAIIKKADFDPLSGCEIVVCYLLFRDD